MTKNEAERRERMVRALEGMGVTRDQADELRRASMTLHRWAEGECGDGNDHASWAIERDEATGRPFRCVYPHTGKSYRTAIPDREAGALRRVARIVGPLGLTGYHQTDPRGVALYVGRELGESNYNAGVAVY